MKVTVKDQRIELCGNSISKLGERQPKCNNKREKDKNRVLCNNVIIYN